MLNFLAPKKIFRNINNRKRNLLKNFVGVILISIVIVLTGCGGNTESTPQNTNLAEQVTANQTAAPAEETNTPVPEPTITPTIPPPTPEPTAAPTITGGGRGELSFITDRDGNLEIYLMNVDGSNQHNLTNHPAADTQMAWSPDGEKLVFISDREGNKDLYIMNADGSDQVLLISLPSQEDNPHWSPDGTKIVFSSNLEGNFDIYCIDIDGSNMINLTNHPARDRYPAWSPDGTQILFDSDRDDAVEIADIFLMDADGTHVINLTASIGVTEIQPYWFPDGENILYVSDRYLESADGAINWETLVLNLEDGTEKNLTNFNSADYYPRLSPDGLMYVFHANRCCDSWEVLLAHIASTDPEQAIAITRNIEGLDWKGFDGAAVWRP